MGEEGGPGERQGSRAEEGGPEERMGVPEPASAANNHLPVTTPWRVGNFRLLYLHCSHRLGLKRVIETCANAVFVEEISDKQGLQKGDLMLYFEGLLPAFFH